MLVELAVIEIVGRFEVVTEIVVLDDALVPEDPVALAV